VAVVREPPHVAQAHRAAQTRQNELQFVAPIVRPGPGPKVRQRSGERPGAAAAFRKIAVAAVVVFVESET